MELSEFLLARIAEDAERAQFVQGQLEAGSGWRDPEPWRLSWQDEYDLLCIEPSRVLAECDAKRRIVEHHAPHRGDEEFRLCAICTEVGPDAQGWPCLTLLLLTLPYADHSEYRPEWKP